MKILLLLTLLAAACSPLPTGRTCTQVNQSRCTVDNLVELCGPNGQWMTVIDCHGEMGTDWFCAPHGDGHTCIRKDVTP